MARPCPLRIGILGQQTRRHPHEGIEFPGLGKYAAAHRCRYLVGHLEDSAQQRLLLGMLAAFAGVLMVFHDIELHLRDTLDTCGLVVGDDFEAVRF